MKPNLPRSWLTLPEREKKIIYKMLEDKYNEAVDHEEAELQKRWLQLSCINLHHMEKSFDATDCLAFLVGFKRIYKKCGRFNSDKEIEAWIKTELDDIFGADGYPAEWVDSLENRESNV